MKDLYNTLYNFGMFDKSLTIRDKIAKSKELGFQGLELISPCDAEAAAAIKEFDMKIMEGQRTMNEAGELQNIDIMQSLGIKFIGGPEGYYDRESALRTAEQLNELGKLVKPYGFKAATHNHTGEFNYNEVENEYCWETVAKNTDPELVSFKMDVGWASIAGANPTYLIRKYSGRVELVHVKPATKILGVNAINTRRMGGQRSTPPAGDAPRPSMDSPEAKKMMEQMQETMRRAQGLMSDYIRDLKEIMTVAQENGALAFILERDGFYKEDRVEVMAEDLAYLRSIWD